MYIADILSNSEVSDIDPMILAPIFLILQKFSNITDTIHPILLISENTATEFLDLRSILRVIH